ncbi:MAG: molecular chaperone Tir, partial [Planctomycetota bacterium]|nr:molecular chaperone Tir [Planctomycetota bacterium]
MSDQMDKVRELLLDLGHEIVQEVPEEELFVIKDEDKGICNMIVDCESPMVEIEQLILEIEGSASNYKRLLQMNRDLIHGSFVLDEEGSKVLFRDTLELEN